MGVSVSGIDGCLGGIHWAYSPFEDQVPVVIGLWYDGKGCAIGKFFADHAEMRRSRVGTWLAIDGRPMAMMLLGANATVTICHSRTEGLAEHIKQADIIIRWIKYMIRMERSYLISSNNLRLP